MAFDSSIRRIGKKFIPDELKPFVSDLYASIQICINNVLLLPFYILHYPARFYLRAVGLLSANLEYKSLDSIREYLNSKIFIVRHNDICFKVFALNSVCYWRAITFSTKEPDTIDWIDSYGSEATLLDIGANIGLFSIYHVLKHNQSAIAFEPAVFNLPAIVRNIVANGLDENIKLITSPLSNCVKYSDFQMNSSDEGGALHAYGVLHDYSGRGYKGLFKYQTSGESIDSLYKKGLLPLSPAIMKIDVDGIEHLILEGGIEYLRSGLCISVLVENSSDFKAQQSGIAGVLEGAGFTLNQSAARDKSSRSIGLQNSVWIRRD